MPTRHPGHRLVLALGLISLMGHGCQGCADNVCSPHHNLVITVGDVTKLKLGSVDFVGDCRDYGIAHPGFTWEVKPSPPTPWQGRGSIIHLDSDGTMRGIAPGSFSVVARGRNVAFETEGVVLPVGWTMKFEPENASLTVGDAQAFRVVVSDSNARALPGVLFAIFPESGTDILRGPGLVASTDKVIFRAMSPGTTLLRGYVGQRAVTTRVVVRGPGDAGTPSP